LFDFSTFPTLETSRLTLREITPDDADAIFRMRSDAEVTKYNSVPTLVTTEQAHELIESMAKGYREKQELRWGITLKNDDAIIGMCGYNDWTRQDYRASIGYDLTRSYWGQGIMPEALRAIITFGFERMSLNRVEADTSAANTASIHVLQKLGFQQEGLLREQYFENGAFHDLMLFSLLHREFMDATWAAHSSTSSR
jgi:[ribosomal protein S5]-alanine N-acetyltransferase